MDRFDNLYTRIFEKYTINEADLPGPPEMGGAPGGSLNMGADFNPSGQRPLGTPPTRKTNNPSPISPEDNIDNSVDTDKSNLPSQKRLQLIKLIALAISTRSPSSKDGDVVSGKDQQKMHKARVLLQHNMTEGNAIKGENQIIRVIAFMQGVDPKDIAAQIDYITPSYDQSDTTSFIAKDEYSALVNLAKDAILASPESLSQIDRSSILASNITSNNAEDQLKQIKGALAQAV